MDRQQQTTLKVNKMNSENLDLPNVFIVGPSGSGKSTSLRNLNPERTIVINTEGKRMPFKAVFGKQTAPKSWGELKAHVDRALAADVDVVAIDSFSSAMDLLYEHVIRYEQDDTRAAWGVYKNEIRDFLSNLKHPGKVVVMTAIEDTVQDDMMRITKTIGVQGAWKGKVESQAEIVLWAQASADGEHTFLTNSDGKCSAKSPMEMLPRTMPNDANKVINLIYDYYGYSTSATGNQAA